MNEMIYSIYMIKDQKAVKNQEFLLEKIFNFMIIFKKKTKNHSKKIKISKNRDFDYLNPFKIKVT